MSNVALKRLEVPTEWSWGVGRLLGQPKPLPFSDGRWEQAQEDAAQFLQTWGEQAFALGWDVLTLFGVSPDAPEQRADQAGLVWLLRGHKVAILTEDTALIDIRKGVHQSFPNRACHGRIPLWSLAYAVKQQQQQVAKHD